MLSASSANISWDLKLHRKLLVAGGLIYFLWYFGIFWIEPDAQNPLISRMAVVAVCIIFLVLSFLNEWVKRKIHDCLIFALWTITAHYFYLFYLNHGGANWVIGSFVVVMAVNFCFFSPLAIVLYSIYVLILSTIIVIFTPTLLHSVFLPGLITIIILAYLGMHSKLKMLHNYIESNHHFQLLFNSTFEGVMVHENRRIVNANRSLEEMLEFPHGTLIGMDIMDLVHPEDREKVLEKLRDLQAIPYEIKILTKTGKIIEAEVRAKDFNLDKKPSRLVTVQRIDDRKKAERERILTKILTDNLKARDEFISIASHELKTPLTSLKLGSQLIEKELILNPSQKIHDFVRLISRQIQRMTELVEAMLDVSKISAGKLQLEMQGVDLAAVIRDVAAMLKNQLENFGCELSLILPENLIVQGDRLRLTQVAENLLTNAMKYGNRKPIKLKLWQEDGRAMLSVEDKGLGIAPQLQEKIFERFERAVSAKNISGMGLGLYIIRQIVFAHGGEISVKSQPGEGSVFLVALPLKPPPSSL